VKSGRDAGWVADAGAEVHGVSVASNKWKKFCAGEL